MIEHKLPIRIYFEDTDAVGIVYYANYLKFAERARTEFLRDENFAHGKEFRESGYGFVVKHCEVDYKASARIDDLIEVYTKVIKVKKVSIVMEQKIYLKDKELVNFKVNLVYINKDFKPTRIPQEILDKI